MNTENVVACPYNQSHQVKESKIHHHVLKCCKNYLGLDLTSANPKKAADHVPRTERPKSNMLEHQFRRANQKVQKFDESQISNPTEYSTVIKPNYKMKGRNGNKRKKRSPPPNPNKRHPFHAGLKFRGKEVCAQRTFDVALGHQQKAQRLHRRRDVSHEQETVILTSFGGTNNEIPSPISKVDPSNPNWFFMDTSFDEISSQIKSDTADYVASSPIKNWENTDKIDELCKKIEVMNTEDTVSDCHEINNNQGKPNRNIVIPKLDLSDEKLKLNKTMHGPETISLVSLQSDDKSFRRIQLEKSLGYPTDQYCADHDFAIPGGGQSSEQKDKTTNADFRKMMMTPRTSRPATLGPLGSGSSAPFLTPKDDKVACLSDESMEAHADSKMKVPESVRNFLFQKKQKKKSKTKRESKKDMSELDDSDDYDIVIESITFI